MLTRELIERLRQRRSPAAWRSSARPPAVVRLSMLEGQEVENANGRVWRIDRPVARLLPDLDDQVRRIEPLLPELSVRDDLHRDLRLLAGSLGKQTLFLDLETCGFAGTMIFLVGLIRASAEGLVLTQLLARDYSEERAMLLALWEIAAGNQVLVSFNGKSFDWPAVHDRSTLHHLGREAGAALAQCPPPVVDWQRGLSRQDWRPYLEHVDLLHHCRRRYRGQLPNCRLQTLEQHLCRRFRAADIPGHAIPEVYHAWVKTQDPAPMRSILHHNALDLVTLFQVALRLLETPNHGVP